MATTIDTELKDAEEALERAIKTREGDLEKLKHALASLRGLVVVLPGQAKLPTSSEYADLGGLEAARRFIRSVGRPLTTRELVDGMLEKGWKTTSRNITASIYATLTNAAKNGKDWERNSKGEWVYKASEGDAKEPAQT